MRVDKIKAIKKAAALEFGKEAEIKFAKGKRIDSNGDCWQLRQINYLEGTPENKGNSPFYRLDVQRGEVNSNIIFNLRYDITKEEIERKFKELNVSQGECMAHNASWKKYMESVNG